MTAEWPFWNSPWELYFEGFVWVPLLQRILLLSGPGLAAMFRHGRHLGWGWHRLLELPRGRAIAANLLIGLLIPVGVGLIIRLVLGPFGEKWDATHLWVSGSLLIFLGLHTIMDVRRTWKVRQLIHKILVADVERYRSYYDKARGWASWIDEHARKDQQTDGQGGLRTMTGRLASRVVEQAGPMLERVMATPHTMAKRWSLMNILEGLAFHLSPVIALAILLSI